MSATYCKAGKIECDNIVNSLSLGGKKVCVKCDYARVSKFERCPCESKQKEIEKKPVCPVGGECEFYRVYVEEFSSGPHQTTTSFYHKCYYGCANLFSDNISNKIDRRWKRCPFKRECN